jgi:uncharacterized protein (TIGR02996 family)
MSEADALLDAIFAAPDDDLPRLVYADWLEDHGQQAYAEFIRLQCEVARLPWNSPEATELWKRISPAWRRLEDDWWPIGWAFRGIDPMDFRRGFYATTLEVVDDDWVNWTPLWTTPLFFPRIRLHVRATYEPDSFWDDRSNSGLSTICHTLVISGWPMPGMYRRGSFHRVRVLDLTESGRDRACLSTIAENTTLSNLRRLRIPAHWLIELPQLRDVLMPFADRIELVEGTFDPDTE